VNSIMLPFPSKLLGPNARVHHMTKHRLTKDYRASTRLIAGQHQRLCLQRPVLGILPVSTTRRRRDLDNVLASLKAALDGLTDAGWWEDDSAILGISIRSFAYSKEWTNGIILCACEREQETDMVERLDMLSTEISVDHNAAWLSFNKNTAPSR